MTVVYATGFFFLSCSRTSLTVMGRFLVFQMVSMMAASSGPRNASSCLPSRLYWERLVFLSGGVCFSSGTISDGRLFNFAVVVCFGLFLFGW